MSFLGSERYFKNYGVMSIAKAALESTALQLAGDLGESRIRVNVIRAAPVNTVAARGIPGFIVFLCDLCDVEHEEPVFSKTAFEARKCGR